MRLYWTWRPELDADEAVCIRQRWRQHLWCWRRWDGHWDVLASWGDAATALADRSAAHAAGETLAQQAGARPSKLGQPPPP